MGENRNAYWVSMGKPEGNTPLRKPRRRCENNIKINLKIKRMGWYGLKENIPL
jgi:hypothetical protein